MDKQLKDLGQCYGSLSLMQLPLFTIMENGYSWFVTDVLTVVGVKLVLDKEKKSGTMLITDGNEKLLYSQDYGYILFAEVPLEIYVENGIMLLPSEH